MSHNYSENDLIEQTCMDLFQDMGWQTANVYNGETFGTQGTIGRLSIADVTLIGRFLPAVIKLNPDIPLSALEDAYEKISSIDSTKDLAELNKEKYYYLRDGIPVDYKDKQGKIYKNKKVKVFDYEHPEQNDFLAVQQIWVEGKSYVRKRPDIVGFVNGIPLVFIELKAHNRKLIEAYINNLRDYKRTIPRIFHTNALVIISNGIESKVGSITSQYEHFHEWKRIVEDQEGIVSMDTILRGICDKSRLLDIFQNFILFDDSIGKVIKLIAHNHQYIGVNKALTHFQELKSKASKGEIDSDEAKKLGVFWHSQGSGKSFSMVFLCQKILRVYGGGYTFLIVTDRAELDKQIYQVFSGVKAVNDKTSHATSGQHLRTLLSTDRRYIFTIIHKFNFDEVITERDNIIVLSDEAHRTQGGTLALNMRKALPNASFIGFTGTPLFKDDELTKRIFGDYVSKYDFKRSIEDGATVPLYYENRGEKLQLDNPDINDEIRQKIEEFEIDSEVEEKLNQFFSREYPILTAEKRLKSIAKDLVYHFNERGYKGKAMLIAIDKVTAVRMYNYITEAWEEYIISTQKAIDKLTDEQEKIIKSQELQWSKETEIAVIVSPEQNEIDRFTAWGLDIESHRTKMNTHDLERDFKDKDHPFRLAIVCAMWITGFDVPSLSTLYLDKPMKSHTLMQAIARANRVHEGKNNGLIVDYIETYKALLEALAIYGEGKKDKKGDGTDGDEPPVKPKEDLISELEEVILATEIFLMEECQFNLDDIINAQDNLHKIRSIRLGYEAILVNDEVKSKFGILCREVFKKYTALTPDKEIYAFRPRRDAINALYTMVTAPPGLLPYDHILRAVQELVNESISTLGIEIQKVEDYGRKVDLSKLDFKKIEEEFLKLDSSKNAATQSLKDRVKKKLDRLLEQNPLRIDYYEKYQAIIQEYNEGLEYKAIKEVFDKLLRLFGELSEEEVRAQREELQDDELTVFDYLIKGKKLTDKEKAKVKEASKKLLERLKTKEFTNVRWRETTANTAAVKIAIDNILFEYLYPTYTNGDRTVKTVLLFDYFKNNYQQKLYTIPDNTGDMGYSMAAES